MRAALVAVAWGLAPPTVNDAQEDCTFWCDDLNAFQRYERWPTMENLAHLGRTVECVHENKIWCPYIYAHILARTTTTTTTPYVFGTTTTSTTTAPHEGSSPNGYWICAATCFNYLKGLDPAAEAAAQVTTEDLYFKKAVKREPKKKAVASAPSLEAKYGDGVARMLRCNKLACNVTRPSCGRLYGQLWTCLQRVPACYEEEWIIAKMTGFSYDRQCLREHAAKLNATSRPIEGDDPVTYTSGVTVSVELVGGIVLGLTVFVVCGVLGCHLAKSKRVSVTPFVPTEHRAIPKTELRGYPMLKRYDRTPNEFAVMHAMRDTKRNMDNCIPGKHTYNVFKPSGTVMYAQPRNYKIKWTEGDPRLPDMIAKAHKERVAERNRVATQARVQSYRAQSGDAWSHTSSQ